MLRTKLVVRSLPPEMSETEFRESIPKGMLSQINCLVFHSGTPSRPGTLKQPRYSFATVNFVSIDALLDFASNYKNVAHRDSSGQKHAAFVDLCLFQKIPAGPDPPDPLQNTFQDQELYKDFLKSKEKEKEESAIPIDRQLEALREKDKELYPWRYQKELEKQTPLLEHLRQARLLERSKREISKSKKPKGKKKKSKKPQGSSVSDTVSTTPDIKILSRQTTSNSASDVQSKPSIIQYRTSHRSPAPK